MTASWTVLAPLVGAALCLLLGGRGARTAVLAAAFVTAAAAVALAAAVAASGTEGQAAGGWAAPLGIELRADGLSALMLVMTAAVALAATLYATRALRELEGARERALWPAWLLMWAALNVLFLSRDVFNIYVALEVLGLAAVTLVVVAGTTGALVAALRYLLAAVVGSLAYLLGVALLYGAAGTLDLDALGAAVQPGPAVAAAAAAMTAGLAIKTALFPLHFWLPAAHAGAPAPVSAVLSALVVKASFYLVLRLWGELFAPVSGDAALLLLGVLGGAAVLAGSVAALRQRRLKLLVAHSSVAQVGYLFVALALGGAVAGGAAEGAAALHAVAHALAKAAMFLAAGNVVYALRHDRLDGMAAAAARLPLTMAAFGLAGLSLVGLPPSGGFAAKWLLLEAAVDRQAWWAVAVVVVGSALAAAYVLVVVAPAVTRGDEGDAPAIRPVPRSMQVVPVVLAASAVLLGLASAPLLDLLSAGRGPA